MKRTKTNGLPILVAILILGLANSSMASKYRAVSENLYDASIRVVSGMTNKVGKEAAERRFNELIETLHLEHVTIDRGTDS